MARYIDADKLKDEFCEACSTNKRYHLSVEECRGKERPQHKWCFKMRLIDETPTADVAPRAEIANAIFDDIEDCLAVHAYTSKSEDYADGASDTIEWVDSKIAELRKKYMGEQV